MIALLMQYFLSLLSWITDDINSVTKLTFKGHSRSLAMTMASRLDHAISNEYFVFYFLKFSGHSRVLVENHEFFIASKFRIGI